MTTLCLTGWQQPADALCVIAPDAVHFDYSAYTDPKAVFEALPRTPRIAIGWSLGGQLLVRAIAAGHVKPDVLILLGAPFQWVANARFMPGMPTGAVVGIKDNYRRDPQGMLKNLNALVALGDAEEKRIARLLNAGLHVWPAGAFWLNELAQTSCDDLDLQHFPPTVIVHGLNDNVIRFPNAQMLASRLPQAQVLLWPQCAHAPHLHDADALREIISDYA